MESLKIKKELTGKTVLITGGAGSIGSKIAEVILSYPIKSLRVLDIDEHALFSLKRKLNNPSKLRLLLGSILDKERLEMACNNVDIIIHTAAIKNIEISEFNPIETVDTNVNGTINLIKTCMSTKPKKFLNISTDKAIESTTLYGTTKQMGERLVSWACHIPTTKFATVRIGNVIETRGNVFEIWNKEFKENKPLSITDKSMKRYFFHVDDAVNFILNCLPLVNNGEIFVPKMKLFNITDLAKKISKKHKIIGLRQGEKLEEILLTDTERSISTEKKNMWIIRPYDK